jgi:hypothetical protein
MNTGQAMNFACSQSLRPRMTTFQHFSAPADPKADVAKASAPKLVRHSS